MKLLSVRQGLAILVFWAMTFGAGPYWALAQTPPPVTATPNTASGGSLSDYSLATQVDEAASAYPDITLYVTVNDKNGKLVPDLVKENFSVAEDGTPVEITEFAAKGETRPVDVIFVFDVTGSMAPYIQGVRQTCIAFAEKLAKSKRDYRLGIISFSDEIVDVYGSAGALTADANEFETWMNRLAAKGGGDDPEISLDAVDHAIGTMKFRDGAQRVYLLITDAPPHFKGENVLPFIGVSSKVTMDDIVTRLNKTGGTLYAIAPQLPRGYVEGTASTYEDLATATGGKFYDIKSGSDFTDIIDTIGETIASQYRLKYRTPSPSSDGRLRDIRVSLVKAGVVVGGSSGAYLQKTLINVRSKSLLGVSTFIILFSLMALALIGPLLMARRRAATALPMNVPPSTPAASAASTSASSTTGPRFCSKCGAPLQPASKFCGRCGYRAP